MNNKTFFLVMVLLVLIAGAVIGYNILVDDNAPAGGQESGFEPIESADFYVYDGNGEKVYLSDFEGKTVVVNFWATWCGPCRSEFPAFESVYEQYGDEIVFMMINQTDGTRDTVESVKTFVEENELDFPVYFDSDLIASRTYGVTSLPLTFVVNEEGYIVNAQIGAISEDRLLDFLGK